MELRPFININEAGNKNIICFGRSNAFIFQLIEEYHVSERIRYICDNNPKIWGETELCGHTYSVVGPKLFDEIELSEYVIIITSSFYEEISEQLKNIPAVRNAYNVIYMINYPEFEIERKYREKYAGQPLENIILFRSGPRPDQYVKGTDFADNSRALFEYMLKNGYNSQYELVWLVKDPHDFAAMYNSIPNVSFVSFDWKDSENKNDTDAYYRVVCLARFIFFTDTYGFAINSRKDQIRIQLWHGCGFKTRMNFGKCEHRYELTTVVSSMYKEIHKRIYGLRDDQVLVTGYAKHDWIFKPYQGDLSEILHVRRSDKYIFWLPTFRIADDVLNNLNQYEINTETGLPIIEYENQFDILDSLLLKLNVTLIVKLHPVQKNNLVLVLDKEYSNIRIFKNQELTDNDLIINRLLASADALISDYSSAAVDFLNADKPIAFTLDDVKEYENSRGFVFDNIREWIPGKEIFTFEDLCCFVAEVAENNDTTKEKRHSIRSKMLKYCDSNNCRRICEALHITLED